MTGQQAQKTYMAAIYCRLSKDDGNTSESSSISTQRDILTRYVREQGWTLAGEYIDDGYSGVSFDRPNFKRMIADIEAGKVNCVLTKDLSRLGRNYLESGAYIEVFFPEHGVRYIALNDNVDTADSITSGFDITPFRNLLNDLYSKDLSKKVKTAKKARLLQGKFLGCNAPYGYNKAPSDKNHLVIDEATAPVIRRIFDLARQGLGISRIRRVLCEERIPRPAADALHKGGNFERYFEDDLNRYVWSNNSVRGILRNPVYAGHLAGYKRPIPSMKSKKRLSVLPEDYLIVENTHEAIIPPEEFELVQRLITSRRKGKPGNSGYDNIFAGMIKCADCGYAMRTAPAHRRKKENPVDNMGYCCNNWGIYGKEACSRHLIEARDLHRAVLDDIRRHAETALTDDKKLLERVTGRLDSREKSETSAMRKELRQTEKRLAELDRLFAKMYEDRVAEKITERNYLAMSTRYEQEQTQLDERAAAIRGRFDVCKAAGENAGQWVSRIKDYANITALTAPLLHTLIDRVTVDEAEVADGARHQTVNIYYKFIGRVE